MTTRKRNLIIAAAAAIVIAAAAVITVVTLNTQSEAEKVNNALAMMSNPDQTVSDVSDNRNAAVTVGSGSDNDTPIVIGETEDTFEADGENVPAESADVTGSDNDKAEKEDTPDDGTTSSEPSGSTKPSGTTKPADTSKPDYPEAPDQDKDSAPASTKAQTNKPAVTVVTTAPAVTTPPSTVRDDLPKVTAEPKYTTAPTEKPAQTEPTVVDKTDSNGFPANPVDGQIFIDADGNRWEYVEFIGWGEANGPAVILQEFPDNYEGGVFGGDQILG